MGQATTLNAQAREFRWRKQGLDGSLARLSAPDVLQRSGWIRSVGGAAPYLGLFARAGISRQQADADAAKIYAASFGKDPDFYDFYRAMQSYQVTFIGNGQDKPAGTTVVLSPQNDYLREFTGRSR